MKRSIILFLITFLVTAGVVATFYYYKSQPALEQGATPAQQTQAVASPADATPVQDEKTATADADRDWDIPLLNGCAPLATRNSW